MESLLLWLAHPGWPHPTCGPAPSLLCPAPPRPALRCSRRPAGVQHRAGSGLVSGAAGREGAGAGGARPPHLLAGHQDLPQVSEQPRAVAQRAAQRSAGAAWQRAGLRSLGPPVATIYSSRAACGGGVWGGQPGGGSGAPPLSPGQGAPPRRQCAPPGAGLMSLPCPALPCPPRPAQGRAALGGGQRLLAQAGGGVEPGRSQGGLLCGTGSSGQGCHAFQVGREGQAGAGLAEAGRCLALCLRRPWHSCRSCAGGCGGCTLSGLRQAAGGAGPAAAMGSPAPLASPHTYRLSHALCHAALLCAIPRRARCCCCCCCCCRRPPSEQNNFKVTCGVRLDMVERVRTTPPPPAARLSWLLACWGGLQRPPASPLIHCGITDWERSAACVATPPIEQALVPYRPAVPHVWLVAQ